MPPIETLPVKVPVDPVTEPTTIFGVPVIPDAKLAVPVRGPTKLAAVAIPLIFKLVNCPALVTSDATVYFTVSMMKEQF